MKTSLSTSIKNRLPSLSKKKWASVILGATLVVGFLLSRGEAPVSYATEPARIAPLEQIISITGSVESTDRLDLRFEQNGILDGVSVVLGQNVTEGSVLGVLQNKQASARLAQSRAQLDEARAALAELIAGASTSQIRLSAARVEEARIRSEQAMFYVEDLRLQQAEDVLQADLSLENKASALALAQSDYEAAQGQNQTTDESALADLDAAYSDAVPALLSAMNETRSTVAALDALWGFIDDEDNTSLLSEIRRSPLSDRIAVNNAFHRANNALEDLEASYADVTGEWTHEQIDAHMLTAEAMLQDLKLAVDLTTTILDNAEDTSLQTQIDAANSDFQTLQSTLNARIASFNLASATLTSAQLNSDSADYSSTSTLNAVEQALNTAQTAYDLALSDRSSLDIAQRIALNQAQADADLAANALEQAEASHEDLIAPPRDAELAQANARVAAAAAAVLESQEALDNTLLVAPSDGIVAQISYKKGETVSANEVAFVLLTDRLQIKANVSEVDIGGLDIGDPATLTLDAFPLSQIFKAKVATINPAETVIQGVIYYETTFLFEGSSEGIRSGMTANLDVLAESMESALQVPLQAVQFDGANPYVFLLEKGAKVRRDVTLGLEGDTFVEIRSGLEEGEDVILYEEN